MASRGEELKETKSAIQMSQDQESMMQEISLLKDLFLSSEKRTQGSIHQQKVTELEATWENQYLRAPWWKIQLGQVMVQLRFQVNFLVELLEFLFWNYGLWCHQGTSK
jgi:hypothetical protein